MNSSRSWIIFSCLYPRNDNNSSNLITGYVHYVMLMKISNTTAIYIEELYIYIYAVGW